MKSHKDTADCLSRDTLESEIPLRYVHDGVVVNKDGSFAIAIKVQFPYLTTYSPSSRDGMYQTLCSAFDTLPDDCRLQIIFGQHSSPLQIGELKKKYEKKTNLVQVSQHHHYEKLESKIRAGELRYFEGLVCLIRDPIITLDKARSRMWETYKASEEGKQATRLERWKRKISYFLFSDEVAAKFTKSEWDEGLSKLCTQGDNMFSVLVGLNLKPVFLKEQELANTLYQFWNPNSSNQGGNAIPISKIPRTFTDYYIRSDLDRKPEEVPKGYGIFRMDNCYHQILTLRIPGELLTFCQWEDILYYSGINNIRIVTNARHGNRLKRIDKLKTSLAQMEGRLKAEPELQTAYDEVLDEITELGAQRGKIWDATIIIHIWDLDSQTLIANSDRLIQQGEKENGMQLTLETEAPMEYWRSMQPCWSRDLDRNREINMNTKQLVTQLPVCGEQHGMDRARIGAVMETATGSVHNYFPHDDLIYANYNSVVIGASRSGKTFGVLDLLIQMMSENPRITVVDLGGSFRSLCAAVGGNYVEIDLDSGMHTINPLYLGKNATYTNEDIERIKLVLEQMLQERSVTSSILTSEEIVTLEEALQQLFDNENQKRENTLTDLRKVLENHDKVGQRLAKRLQRYCGSSGKGKLFDGPSKLDTNSKFTVYDLTKAAEDKEVTPLMFQILINNVIRTGMADMAEQKFLVFDECWKFLSESEGVANFVEYAFRGLAKFNFSSIAITQGVEELSALKNASAILNNTSQKFIYKLESPKEAQLAKETLGLNDTEEEIIKNLVSETGHFSQCLHIESLKNGGTRSTVLVKRASPIQYAMSTTNGRDQGEIKTSIKSGLSLKQAIMKFAKQYPHGVSQAE